MAEYSMVQTVKVTKPVADVKSYRYVVLKNSIKALLISDPRIDITPGMTTGTCVLLPIGLYCWCSPAKQEIWGSKPVAASGEDGSQMEVKEESEGSENIKEEDEQMSCSGQSGDGMHQVRKAACALAVGVGSFADPRDMQVSLSYTYVDGFASTTSRITQTLTHFCKADERKLLAKQKPHPKRCINTGCGVS